MCLNGQFALTIAWPHPSRDQPPTQLPPLFTVLFIQRRLFSEFSKWFMNKHEHFCDSHLFVASNFLIFVKNDIFVSFRSSTGGEKFTFFSTFLRFFWFFDFFFRFFKDFCIRINIYSKLQMTHKLWLIILRPIFIKSKPGKYFRNKAITFDTVSFKVSHVTCMTHF